MASTLSSTTLTVTLTEEITINGQPVNSVNTLSYTGIKPIDKRIVTVPTASEVTLLNS